MDRHTPFNERKLKANNHQTLGLTKDSFLYKLENEMDAQISKSKILSSQNIRKRLSGNKLNQNHKGNPGIKFRKSKTLNKLSNSEEYDFYEMNEKEKEDFLKLRGRKLKDYLNDFLNTNEIEDNIEGREKQMESFSLHSLLEDDKMASNNILCHTLRKYCNIDNETRSRTSAPVRGNLKNIYNKNEVYDFNQLTEAINKARKLTFSYYNQYDIKNNRKFSIDGSFIESNISVPIVRIEKITNPKNSINEPVNIPTLESINSVSELLKKENSNHSYDQNYLTLLNKHLSTQKLGLKKQISVQQKSQEKRAYIKFQNVYDSFSDDQYEEYKSCQIYPDSKFNEIWDIIIFFITIYTLVYVPYDMAFINTISLYTVSMDLICDVIYIVDVILQFLIPISISDDKYITSYTTIAKNYIKTWFILDFFSSVPLSSVINLMNLNIYYAITTYSKTSYKIITIAKISRIYRMVKLIRLLKLIKLAKSDKKIKYLNIFQSSFRSNLYRLISFFLYFIVFIHMLSCIWVFIGGLDYPNWIVNSNLSDSSDFDTYVASIYFNLTTIFTIGYGDITSVNSYERICNIIIMCVGIMLYTFAVSSMSKLFQKKDLKTKKLDNNLAFLEDISLKHKLNNKLYSKIKQCLKYDYSVNTEDKFNMLSNLPEIIKIELINEMHKDIIKRFFFFKNTNSAFRAKIMMMLKPLKGEILIKENEFVNEMFFIKKGVLSIHKNYAEQPLKLIEVRRNEHFGEIFMLMNEKSSFDLVVKSKYAELYFLKKVDLFDIYGEYKSILESILQKSTYNSLMLLKKFKSSVNNITKRKSLVELNTKNNNSEKSIFKEFLKKDEDLTNINCKRKILANLSKKRSKENMQDISTKENYLDHSSREKKLQNNFKTIKEENEDEELMNFSLNSHLITNNDDCSPTREKNKEMIYIPKNTQNEMDRKFSYSKNNSSFSNSLSQSRVRKKNSFSGLKHFCLPMIEENEIRFTRSEKKRNTGVIFSRLKKFNFEIQDEITKQSQSSQILPLDKRSLPLNIRTNDRSIRRKSVLISKVINKNIINDSMNIKASAMFFSNKFEKWTLNNQIKKLENILITFQQIVKKVEG